MAGKDKNGSEKEISGKFRFDQDSKRFDDTYALIMASAAMQNHEEKITVSKYETEDMVIL